MDLSRTRGGGFSSLFRDFSGPGGGNISEISGPGGGGNKIFLQRNFFSAGEAGRNFAKNRGSPRNLQKTCFWRSQKGEIKEN